MVVILQEHRDYPSFHGLRLKLKDTEELTEPNHDLGRALELSVLVWHRVPRELIHILLLSQSGSHQDFRKFQLLQRTCKLSFPV